MSTNATPHPLLDIACTAQAHTHTRLLHFLEDSEISEDVTTTIKGNDLGRKEFLCLNEGEIKELAPKIGARVNI